MKHALILRLLNVPLFTALFGSLVMIGFDTMQGDKAAHAKRFALAKPTADAAPSVTPNSTQIAAAESTEPVSLDDIGAARIEQQAAQFEQMLGDESGEPEQSHEAEQSVHPVPLVEASVADPTSNESTPANNVGAIQSLDQNGTTEPQESYATETGGDPVRSVAITQTSPELEYNTASGVHAEFASGEPNETPGDFREAAEINTAPVAPAYTAPLAEGILQRRAERQRRLAEQARAAADDRRRTLEADEGKPDHESAPSSLRQLSPGQSAESAVVSNPGEQEDVAPGGTETISTDEIHLSNAVDNKVSVIFLLGTQVRKLAPGQTTIINQDTTLRFDRGRSFGAATEQLVLGRSYEFQVSARGWSVVRNPTVGNAATE